MRNVLLIMAMLLFTSVLGPGMWHLWVYAGSGNSNFFYAVTLAYCTAQVCKYLTRCIFDSIYSFFTVNELSNKKICFRNEYTNK